MGGTGVKGERETRRYVDRKSSRMDPRVKTVSLHRWCTKCNEGEEDPLVINEAVGDCNLAHESPRAEEIRGGKREAGAACLEY